MGDFSVRSIKDKYDRNRMYQHCLDDIKTFDIMWNENMFDNGPVHIGAEQELCIVDQQYQPAKSALYILDKVNDRHYTNELGLYNLEINLDPEKLEGKCFSIMENKLLRLLQLGHEQADLIQNKILMTGILPTINPQHLDFDYMTPIERYRTLSQMLYDMRGGSFEIYLQGVDELMASLGSVLFEACNTSFQLHLQIRADQFIDKFNWSQMIAGPVLAACSNSPLLFGRELWSETRIALFKQSLDTRSSKNHLRKKLSRVYFGTKWLQGSPVELWKNELIRFPLVISSDALPSSSEMLRSGETPELRAIRLHNGTTYTWNRLCYGPTFPAHLRIECRYLPAGPSVIDEISNFAFWIGLMNAIPSNWHEEILTLDFKDVKFNFLNAARAGIDSSFVWMGKAISADRLLLDELIPLAYEGLQACGIDEFDISKYLQVIIDRIRIRQTGSKWIINSYRQNKRKYKSRVARQELVAEMIHHQRNNTPVSEWPIQHDEALMLSELTDIAKITAGHIMSSNIYAVAEDTSLSLIEEIMKWKSIHHLPVENASGSLVGIITDGMLHRQSSSDAIFAADIMETELISTDRDTSVLEIKQMMHDHSISCVPITRSSQLVGIVTLEDIKRLDLMLAG